METLIELAEKEGLGFTRQTIEETFKDKYMNLEEYLGGFQYTVAVMQNAEVGKWWRKAHNRKIEHVYVYCTSTQTVSNSSGLLVVAL